ncbi:glycine betaine ABC transporter substrate-binding protein [Azospirillum sp. A29]|jgi:glycine betaine/proline transport system substrate-binding protein|uniref:glycine betaine ABC transporter substrate-binding protein n=1 Tax=Azospirillum sp. A29 TaxID=3160606 RepID=UPI00366BE277
MSHTLRVGHIDLSFHDAAARAVESILGANGHRIESAAALHEEMFQRMVHGEIDILVSAWLPASHGAYLAPFEREVTKITVLYEPYCIWGVPDCAPEDEVVEVADLLKPPALDRMERFIQGINPGAGISRFSRAIVAQYELGRAGNEFRTGTEEGCFGRFIEAVDGKRWVVVPLWHPQWLHNRYRIRARARARAELQRTFERPGQGYPDRPQGGRGADRTCRTRRPGGPPFGKCAGQRARRPTAAGIRRLGRLKGARERARSPPSIGKTTHEIYTLRFGLLHVSRCPHRAPSRRRPSPTEDRGRGQLDRRYADRRHRGAERRLP